MDFSLWQPTASLQNLNRRAELLWLIRQFFRQRGFAEVQTPILSHDTVIDRHIDPLRLPGSELALPQLAADDLYLQTSPEFCMKRLLAAGMNAIYEVKSVFRAGERGTYHNPEFTMLEWYQVGADLGQGIRLLSDLVQAVLPVDQVQFLTYAASFQTYLGREPLSASVPELAELALSRQLPVERNWSDDRDDWLNLLFSELIQPQLGRSSPTIVTHYPATQSALARFSPDDPRTAERYELFVDGVELANGYHELLDPAELEERNRLNLAQRAGDGKPPLPSSSRLLSAMRAGLPACSGCALGLDRLLMVMLGTENIDDVIAFPIERA